VTRRVVITGVGAVTPLANDVPGTWEALLAGRSGIARIELFDPSDLEVQIAAEIKGFDPVELFGRREARRNDMFTLYAMGAARQAVADSGLVFDDGWAAWSPSWRTTTCTGTKARGGSALS
jgi:3-oxoacyl-[acyl-carrier-protein] synthase II